MTSVAYLPIVADRYGPLVRHLYVAGLDLTGVPMRAQIRFSGDSPGKPYVDLLTVTNGNAQGLRLVEVTTDAQGLPTSHVEIVINETTMEGLPYAGELGDAVQFAWDMQITLAGRKRRLAKGEFEITGDGVTGADAAPVNRPIGYGRPVQPITSPWKAARLTFGEEQVTVSIVDAELVAPLVGAAERARDAVKPLYGTGAPSGDIGVAGSWYRDMTDPLSPLEWFKTDAGWQGPRSLRGNPGSNVMAIGLFVEAASLFIPVGTNVVRTAGHTITGRGIADYLYDPAITAAYAAQWDRACFVSANGRGFRIADILVSPDNFGTKGDGIADDSVAAQQAYDYRVARGIGGDLFFEDGVYRLSLNLTARGVDIRGRARVGTVLRPVSPDAPILRALYDDGGWASVTIADLSFKGDATEVDGRPVYSGTAFMCGHDDYQDGDHLVLSTRFERCDFVDLDVCINRPYGNIGITVEDSSFSRANYHIRARAMPGKMHAGIMTIRGGHMQGAEKAVCYLDGGGIVGTGQVLFDQVTIELNNGFVFYMKNMLQPEAVPTITIRGCWNEANADRALHPVATVSIDGQQLAPEYAYLENVTHATFQDTPVGSMKLINSAVALVDCAVDHASVDADINSLVDATRARSFTHQPNFRVSSLGATPAGSAFAPSFDMPHPTHFTRAERGQAAIRLDCGTPFVLFGSVKGQETVSAGTGDAALPGMTDAQDITIAAGESYFPAMVAVPARVWIAWSCTVKRLSGPPVKLALSGSSTVTGERLIEGDEWVTYRGMRDNENALAQLGLWFTGMSGVAKLRLGGLCLMTFATRQKAINWVNSGSFPG